MIAERRQHPPMWLCPQSPLSILHDEVHVWRAELEMPAAQLANLWELLSADERRRAQRSAFDTERRRFVARRGILRILLSGYQGIHPAEVAFSSTAHGKLVLQPRGGQPHLCFNLAHAGERALYAVSRARALGIDVERVSPLLDYEPIVSHFFAAEERAALGALAPPLRLRAFYQLWAYKEAYVKACGLGLSLPLDRFAVAPGPDHTARLLYAHTPAETARWSLRALPGDDDFTGALVVDGAGWRLSLWHYSSLLNLPWPT